MYNVPLTIALLILGGLDAAAVLIYDGQIGTTGLPPFPIALTLHTLATVLALLCLLVYPPFKNRPGNGTYAVLLSLFFYLTPVIGPLACSVLILTNSSRGNRQEKDGRFILGNPLLEHPERGPAMKRTPYPPIAHQLSAGQTSLLRQSVLRLKRQVSLKEVRLLRALQEYEDAHVQLTAQGILAAIVERLEDQLQKARALVEECPKAAQAHIRLVEVLLHAHAVGVYSEDEAHRLLEEAVARVDTGLHSCPESGRLLYLKALCLLKAGRTDAIPDLYGRLLALPHAKKWATAVEMEYFARIGNWQRGTETFRRALVEGHQLPQGAQLFWLYPRTLITTNA